MPSSLYHGTASLCVPEQKGDFPQRKLQEGSTSVPCSVTLHKCPCPGKSRSSDICSSLSCQLTCCRLTAASSLHNPFYLITSCFASEICDCLLSLYLLHLLFFSIFPLGILSDTKVPASLSQSTLLFLKKFPLEAQEGIAITNLFS